MHDQVDVWRTKALPNWWLYASREPRVDSFERLAMLLQEASALAWGSIAYDPAHPPSPASL